MLLYLLRSEEAVPDPMLPYYLYPPRLLTVALVLAVHPVVPQWYYGVVWARTSRLCCP